MRRDHLSGYTVWYAEVTGHILVDWQRAYTLHDSVQDVQICAKLAQEADAIVCESNVTVAVCIIPESNASFQHQAHALSCDASVSVSEEQVGLIKETGITERNH